MANQTALLPEHQNLVESLVSSGRYEGPHAVLTAALALLQEKERERAARLSALHAVLAAELSSAHASGDAAAAPLPRLAPQAITRLSA
ncbi:type II toxin-antitoxin system ParD family antitoxin [Xanthobacter sp. TB0136]|uniref:type II toxin-antitoxin system ParD family antitoxin n=1 Tax=Xanthobacter sp. TB0136 TaxID=3459177 RepID=UPI00403A225D